MVLDTFFSWFRKKEEPLILDGVQIPPGYTPYRHAGQKTSYVLCQKGEDISHLPIPPGKKLRAFYEGGNHQIAYLFLFDEHNQEYQKLLGQSRKDTKSLAVALAEEIGKRDLFVWPSLRRFPNSKRGTKIRFEVLLRPVHFSSFEDKSNRWSSKATPLSFVFHFDENGHFQCIRYFQEGSSVTSNISSKHLPLHLSIRWMLLNMPMAIGQSWQRSFLIVLKVLKKKNLEMLLKKLLNAKCLQ